jgi:hypothetical protein
LQQAREHVARGASTITRQRKLVEKLEGDGSGYVGGAQKLLRQFEELQALHVADRDRLEKDLLAMAPPKSRG